MRKPAGSVDSEPRARHRPHRPADLPRPSERALRRSAQTLRSPTPATVPATNVALTQYRKLGRSGPVRGFGVVGRGDLLLDSLDS